MGDSKIIWGNTTQHNVPFLQAKGSSHQVFPLLQGPHSDACKYTLVQKIESPVYWISNYFLSAIHFCKQFKIQKLEAKLS